MDMATIWPVQPHRLPEVYSNGSGEFIRIFDEKFLKPTVHIVDCNSSNRTDFFRMVSSCGYHCEVYSGLDEFISYRPASGVALIHDDHDVENITRALRECKDRGVPVTIAGYSESPALDRVTIAMQAGAMHYFKISYLAENFESALQTLTLLSQRLLILKHNWLITNRKLKSLTPPESEIIKLMSEGSSNEVIGRAMGISTSKVEFHQMTAFGKLGARRSGDAVRIWLLGSEGLNLVP